MTTDQSRPEIAQVMFKKNENLKTNDLERDLFETRKKIEKVAREPIKNFYMFVQLKINCLQGMFLAEMLSSFILILTTKINFKVRCFTKILNQHFSKLGPCPTIQNLST